MYSFRTTLSAALVAAAISWASQAPGAEARNFRFDIASQSMAQALRAYARVSGQQIIFADDLVRDIKPVSLRGEYTAEVALSQLLQGTGLTAKKAPTGAITIVRVGDAASALDSAALMRVAGLDVDSDADKTSAGRPADGSREGAQVVVKGERERSAPFTTGSLDLTRTEDDVLPFTVFTADEIRTSGASSLPEFLRNRLPQNFAEENNAELQAIPGEASSARVDMRGWGQGETVFLLNGRPMAPEYAPTVPESGNAPPNLRGIPLASIERIEILTSAGSAIYGANATGGVINIITRRDFRGGQLSVGYDSPADVLRPQRSVNLTYGLSLGWGMGLRLAATYNDVEPLRVDDRAGVMLERYRRLVMERDPNRLIPRVANPAEPGSLLYTSAASVNGRTANIRAATNTINLFAGLAGVPGSNFTTVPDGSTGAGGRAAYTPGVYNLALADAGGGLAGTFARQAQIGPVTRNQGFSIGLDRDFGQRWRWSLDYRYGQNESEGRRTTNIAFSSPAANYATGVRNSFGGGTFAVYPQVPAGAVSNPFGQALVVALVDAGMDMPRTRASARNITWEASSTLQGQIGSWRGFLDLAYTDNAARSGSGIFMEPDGGWNAAFLSGAYNPFVDPRVVPYANAGFYENGLVARYVQTGGTTTSRSTLKASGPLLELPAGPLQLTAGGGWERVERTPSFSTTTAVRASTGETAVPTFGALATGDTRLSSGIVPFVFDSYAGYAEATVPLLSSRQDVALVRRLELFGSGRVDRTVRETVRSRTDARPVEYSNTARISAFGFAYEPLQGVAFRASRSVGVKPPSLGLITPADPPAPTSAPTTVTDPRRNNESRQITYSMYITGGRPDLKPESTRSTNLGLILSPRWLPGLRLSLDYLESRREDAITSITAQDAVNLEAEFPDIVQRGAPDGSGVGPITFIDRRNINLRLILSRSLDFALEQEIRQVGAGRLLLAARGTKNLNFKVQTTNAGAVVDQVRNPNGTFSSVGLNTRQIKWNGNGQLRWEGPSLGIGWSTRYYDYVLLPASLNLTAVQGGRITPAFEHDLNFDYRMPGGSQARGMRGWLADTAFNFGVRNVFDRPPRFSGADQINGIAPYDFSAVRGRTLWLQVSKDFQ